MKITKEYLNDRPLSFSSLKQFIKSPQHYIQYISKQKEPTESMMVGSVVHNLILEPDTFEKKFVIEPEFNKRTNQGKEDYQKFVDEMSTKDIEVIPQKVFMKAKDIVNNFIHSHNYKYIQDTDIRECRFDKVHSTSLPVCGYIDAMSSDYNIEIKTVSSAEYSDIQRDFFNLKYHLQAGIYNWVNEKKVMYIVIENAYPYLSRVFIASDTFLESGRLLFEKAMSDFSYCMDMDSFDMGYEYYSGIEPLVIDLPGWAKKGGEDGD